MKVLIQVDEEGTKRELTGTPKQIVQALRSIAEEGFNAWTGLSFREYMFAQIERTHGCAPHATEQFLLECSEDELQSVCSEWLELRHDVVEPWRFKGMGQEGSHGSRRSF